VEGKLQERKAGAESLRVTRSLFSTCR